MTAQKLLGMMRQAHVLREKEHRVTIKNHRRNSKPSYPKEYSLQTSGDYCPNCVDTSPRNRPVIVNGMQYNEFNNDEFKKV